MNNHHIIIIKKIKELIDIIIKIIIWNYLLKNYTKKIQMVEILFTN